MIKIGDSNNESEVHLPAVLKDRKRAPSASNSTSGQQQETSPNMSSEVVVVNADVNKQLTEVDRHQTNTPTSTSSPLSGRITLHGK